MSTIPAVVRRYPEGLSDMMSIQRFTLVSRGCEVIGHMPPVFVDGRSSSRMISAGAFRLLVNALVVDLGCWCLPKSCRFLAPRTQNVLLPENAKSSVLRSSPIHFPGSYIFTGPAVRVAGPVVRVAEHGSEAHAQFTIDFGLEAPVDSVTSRLRKSCRFVITPTAIHDVEVWPRSVTIMP